MQPTTTPALLFSWLVSEVTDSLDVLLTGLQSNMAIGESAISITTPHLRMLTLVTNPSHLQEQTLTTPLTDYELLAGTAVGEIEFDVSLLLAATSAPSPVPTLSPTKFRGRPIPIVAKIDTATSAPILGVAVILFTSNPNAIRTNSSVLTLQTNKFVVNNNAAIGASSTSSSSSGHRMLMPVYATSSTIGVQVLLQNYQAVEYSGVHLSHHGVECHRNASKYYVHGTCLDGYVWSVECNGLKGFFNITCPSHMDIPECTIWDAAVNDFVTSPMCKVVDYSTTQTTCKCAGAYASSSGHQRYLQQQRELAVTSSSSSSISSNAILQQFSSRMGVVSTSFASTYSAAPPLVLVQYDQVIVGSIVGLVGLFLVLFFAMSIWDSREIRFARRDKLKESKVPRTAENFFEKIMPDEFKNRRWYAHLTNRLLIEHTWLCLFAPYHKDRPYRIIKLTIAFSNLLSFFFFNTALARIFFADDGTCEPIIDAHECLRQVVPLNLRFACSYNFDNESCSFAIPIVDFLTVLALTLVITTCTIPVNKLLEVMTRRIFGNRTNTISQVLPWTSLRKMQLVVPGSDGLEEYHTRRDEFQLAQTTVAKMLHAARLRKLQEFSDLCMPLEEAEKLQEVVNARKALLGLGESVEFDKSALSHSDIKHHSHNSNKIRPHTPDTRPNTAEGETQHHHNNLDDEASYESSDGGSGSIVAASPQDSRRGGKRRGAVHELIIKEREEQESLSQFVALAASIKESKLNKKRGTVYDEYGDEEHKMEDDLYMDHEHDVAHPDDDPFGFEHQHESRLRSKPKEKGVFGGVKKPSLYRPIVAARHKAERIKSEAQLLQSDEDKEIFLMKQFILSNLSGSKHYIAKRYLFGEGRFESVKYNTMRRYARYVSMLLLPLVWAAMIYYIYIYTAQIGSRSSMLWIVVSIISLALDLVLLQPSRIWLKWIVINSVVSEDVRELVLGLKSRFMSILQRKAGVMRDANSLIQHLNPVCRVARLFPQLPISRFLFSLNDHDVPYALKKPGGALDKRSSSFLARISFALAVTLPTLLLLWISSLPAPLQDAVTDLGATLGINIVGIVLYEISLVSAPFAIFIVIGMVGAVFVREFMIAAAAQAKLRLRVMAKLEREARKRQADLADGGTVQLSQQEIERALDALAVDDEEPVVQLQEFVEEMDSVVTYRSKFKPQIKEVSLLGPPKITSIFASQGGGSRNNNSSIYPTDFPIDTINTFPSPEQRYLASTSPSSAPMLTFDGEGGGGNDVDNHRLFLDTQTEFAPTASSLFSPFARKNKNKVAEPFAASLVESIETMEQNIRINLESLLQTSLVEDPSLKSMRKAARRSRMRSINAGDLSERSDLTDRNSIESATGGGGGGGGGRDDDESSRHRRRRASRGGGLDLGPGAQRYGRLAPLHDSTRAADSFPLWHLDKDPNRGF